MSTTNEFSKFLKLYLGGYKHPKVLRVTLFQLLKYQDHSLFGAFKLIALWPGIRRKALKIAATRKECALEEHERRMRDVIMMPNTLLDKISKTETWKGCYMPIPTFGTFGAITDDQLSADGTMARHVPTSIDPDSQ